MCDHILATAGRGAASRLRVAVDLLNTALSHATTPAWVESTAARLRAAASCGASVLVDLDVMVAARASVARARMHSRDAITSAGSRPDSLRYEGTPEGLAGLIGDISRADVADGVTLRPLPVATLQEIINTALPALGDFAFAIGAAKCDLIRTCLRQHYRALAPATARIA